MDEYTLNEPLNTIEPEKIPSFLVNLNKQLNIGGKFIFHFYDIRLLADLINKSMSYEHIDAYLYKGAKSIMDVSMITRLMPNLGFKIKLLDSNRATPVVTVVATKERNLNEANN